MSERTKNFRRGETENRPIGGKVANEPLPQALYAFAKSRGHQSQSSFSRSLGKKDTGVVSSWFRGKTSPDPESMSTIFLTHSPTKEEVESLIEPWSMLLMEGKIGQTKRGSARAMTVSTRLRKPSKTPLGKWVDEFLTDSKLTLAEFSSKIQFRRIARDTPGKATMYELIDRADDIGLGHDQKVNLIEAVAQTIEQKTSQGHRLHSGMSGLRAKKLQKSLNCTTHTPQEAATEIGVTREAVRQRRVMLGLPLIMNEEQYALLKQTFNNTIVSRQRRVNAQKRRRTKLHLLGNNDDFKPKKF